MCEDVRKPWQNLARRMQATASVENNGMSVLTVKVLVDENNNPVAWTSPSCVKIEPRSSAKTALATIISSMSS